MPDKDPDHVPAWRLWFVPLVLLTGIAAVFVLGRAGVITGLDDMLAQAGMLADSPWGLPALIGAFCLGAYLGLPQFALIGVAIVAFGPAAGFAFAWLATLCSGTLTFWTGRALGTRIVKRYSGKRLDRITRLISENAFTASAIVRTIPTGPFLLVNMVFGASGARFLPFLLGLAAGSVPKLALIAFAGESLSAALTGSLWRAVLVGAVTVAIWLGIGMASNRLLVKD